jgi:hypothetical protein
LKQSSDLLVLLTFSSILVRFALFVDKDGYCSPESTYTFINGKILIRGKLCREMSEQTIQEGSDFVHWVMARFLSWNVCANSTVSQ